MAKRICAGIVRRDHQVAGPDYIPLSSRQGLDGQGRVASEFGYRGLTGKDRTERINLGLALLQLLAKPGVPLALDDIAAWCGCSSSAIQIIEEKAMRKLSHRMRFMRTTDTRLTELLEAQAYARTPATRKETV